MGEKRVFVPKLDLQMTQKENLRDQVTPSNSEREIIQPFSKFSSRSLSRPYSERDVTGI